jgi:hypothetical protein
MQIAVVDLSKFEMQHSFASRQLTIHLWTDQEIWNSSNPLNIRLQKKPYYIFFQNALNDVWNFYCGTSFSGELHAVMSSPINVLYFFQTCYPILIKQSFARIQNSTIQPVCTMTLIQDIFHAWGVIGLFALWPECKKFKCWTACSIGVHKKISFTDGC